VTPFQLAAVFVSLVALGSWINARTARFPREVAMMLVGLAGALTLWTFQRFAPGAAAAAAAIGAINRIDFTDTVLGYMLGFLLFAGAMQVDLGEMRKRLLSVSLLATAGVIASILIVGFGLWSVAHALALPLSLPWALVFGALISPTDPIAVLAAVKRGHLSKTLQVIMQGEALFNDGVGIVAFTSLVALAAGEGLASPAHLLGLVFIQAAGGLLLGLASGFAIIRAMRAIDDFAVEVILSIALCMGVYAGAQALGLSGPIGVVGAGLLIDGERGATRGEARSYLRNFWTLVDEILNAVLFLLLGFETLVVPFQPGQIGLAVASILLVLFARICVVAPWALTMGRQQGARRATAVMVWGGLHGALSLALALSIPQGPERALILSATYAVVAFSMIVQGLTFGPLTAALKRTSVDV
jgi:CPA1 family monovalent cation:H+ antiporter